MSLFFIERLAGAVALDDDERQALHDLIRCEPALAGEAFSSPPDGRASSAGRESMTLLSA